jgi:hypothetical protein
LKDKLAATCDQFKVDETAAITALLGANAGLEVTQLDILGLFKGVMQNPAGFGFDNIDTAVRGSTNNPDKYLFWDTDSSHHAHRHADRQRRGAGAGRAGACVAEFAGFVAPLLGRRRVPRDRGMQTHARVSRIPRPASHVEQARGYTNSFLLGQQVVVVIVAIRIRIAILLEREIAAMIKLNVNAKAHEVDVDPQTPLLG